jgi:SAM-dependent methyltransferase
MSRYDDPRAVRSEYSSEERLLARSSIYAGATGPDTNGVLLEQLLALSPRRVLEVGCGPGALAERLIGALPDVELQALDISTRMVELTAARGIRASVGDVQELPFADGTFDCVIAAWMLYHAPDLERGLSELERVLAAGGSLVAVTNGREHLREVWELLGTTPHELSFGAENARGLLARHFPRVREQSVEGVVTFPDRDAVSGYVAASIGAPDLAGTVPEFIGPLRARRENCILIATKG